MIIFLNKLVYFHCSIDPMALFQPQRGKVFVEVQLFSQTPSILLYLFVAANWVALSLPRSMGSTHRSRARPLGRNDSKAVADGNLLCSRAVVLMLLCACKGIFWALEQPSSSTMEWHPLFQRLIKLVTVRRIFFRMSQFGGPTPKRTVLYSSAW